MNKLFNTLVCSYLFIAKFIDCTSSQGDELITRKSSIEKNFGEKLKLVCSEGNSEFQKWEWKKDQKELKSIENQRIIINESHDLLIRNLIKSDSGIYECSINNRTVHSIKLTIKLIESKEYELIDDQYNKFIPLILTIFSLTTSLVLFISLVNLLSGTSFHGNKLDSETMRKKQEETFTIESFAQLNLNKFQRFYDRIDKQSMIDSIH